MMLAHTWLSWWYTTRINSIIILSQLKWRYNLQKAFWAMIIQTFKKPMKKAKKSRQILLKVIQMQVITQQIALKTQQITHKIPQITHKILQIANLNLTLRLLKVNLVQHIQTLNLKQKVYMEISFLEVKIINLNKILKVKLNKNLRFLTFL